LQVPLLSDELHERLRRAASCAKTSMEEFIRVKLQQSAPARLPERRPSKDPILKVAGICGAASLSGRIDEELYGVPGPDFCMVFQRGASLHPLTD